MVEEETVDEVDDGATELDVEVGTGDELLN